VGWAGWGGGGVGVETKGAKCMEEVVQSAACFKNDTSR
jgi:hypothetical protein